MESLIERFLKEALTSKDRVKSFKKSGEWKKYRSAPNSGDPRQNRIEVYNLMFDYLTTFPSLEMLTEVFGTFMDDYVSTDIEMQREFIKFVNNWKKDYDFLKSNSLGMYEAILALIEPEENGLYGVWTKKVVIDYVNEVLEKYVPEYLS